MYWYRKMTVAKGMLSDAYYLRFQIDFLKFQHKSFESIKHAKFEQIKLYFKATISKIKVIEKFLLNYFLIDGN